MWDVGALSTAVGLPLPDVWTTTVTTGEQPALQGGLKCYINRKFSNFLQKIKSKAKRVSLTSLFAEDEKELSSDLLDPKVDMCHEAHQLIPHRRAHFRPVCHIPQWR